jgi:hypothetical protein
MDASLVIVLIVALVVLAAVAWLVTQRRRSAQLHERFGPEYDRTVRQAGDRRRAEDELAAREQRVKQLEIRPLQAEERARFADRWRTVQGQFVDEPAGAVQEADRLVAEVMRARGYPVEAFEQRVADISVDHPQVVEHYRAAHATALRQERGDASTEDLRQALVHYRALFADLLETEATEAPESTGRRETPRTELREREAGR